MMIHSDLSLRRWSEVLRTTQITG